jgi:hypothetical protein
VLGAVGRLELTVELTVVVSSVVVAVEPPPACVLAMWMVDQIQRGNNIKARIRNGA